MKTILAFILSLFALSAQADWYAGAGVGLANDEIATNLVVGHGLNKYFSVETGFADFGESKDIFSNSTNDNTNTSRFLQETLTKREALSLSAVAKLPLIIDDGMGVYIIGRAGFARWRSSYTIKNTTMVFQNEPPGGVVSTESSIIYGKLSGFDAVLAAGIEAAIENTFSIRLEYSRHVINSESISGITMNVMFIF